jgi:predicted ATPase
LVLDNVEHLLVGPVIVELLAEILRAAPEVKLLVTSSEPLALQAEWLLPVGGLTYPGDDCQPVTASGGCEDCPHSAVQLFLQSAARSRVGFRPTAQDCATAIQICQMLEGLPLAIEIAATWVRAHDLATIAREVARSLDFLTSPLRDVPARHRSVRAIFDHTWDLLTPAERAALSQASVFRGGFHLAAANEILAVQAEGGAEQVPARFPIPNILVSLVNKSLLRCASDGRYEMHELLRQFAAEKLEGRGWSTGGAQATADEMHKRHGEYYLKLVDRWAADLDGERSHLARLAIQHDLDNIRQAWQWAIVYARSDLVEKARFDNPPPWMYDMA